MKINHKNIITLLFILMISVLNIDDQRLYSQSNRMLGKVAKINRGTGEIIIASPSAGRNFPMGRKLVVWINSKPVILEVTFPMLTIAKCRLLPSHKNYLNKLRKEMPVYIYMKNNRKPSGAVRNSRRLILLPLFGVTPGITTAEELAQLGTRTRYTNKKTGEPLKIYRINGMSFTYNDKGITTFITIYKSSAIPEPWKKLGLNWHLTYNQWIRLLKRLGYTVGVGKKMPDRSGDSRRHVLTYASKDAKVKITIQLSFLFNKGQNFNTPATLDSLSLSCK